MDDFDDSMETDNIASEDVDELENIGDTGETDNEDIKVEADEIEEMADVNIDNEVVDVAESNEDIEVNGEIQENGQNIEANTSDETDELQESLEKESPYSPEVNEFISSQEELQVYKEAGLVEQKIEGRTCLIREKLDLNYVDKQSGLTNAELIAKGRSPYDAKTGERIELHHIGQDFNGPFAELKSFSEHDLYSKTLHKSEMDSWRRDPEKVNEYAIQRKAHWKRRFEEELK